MSILTAAKITGKQFLGFCKRNSSTILRVTGDILSISATVEGIHATPKAIHLIDSEQITNKKEIVKKCWKFYIPTALMEVGSLGCSIASGKIDAKHIATLAGLLTASEKARKEYKEKVVEAIGDKKESLVEAAVHQKHIDENPPKSGEIITPCNASGIMQMCRDEWTGRYFYSNKSNLDKVELEVNRELIADMYISLNEVYELMNIPGIPSGNDIGWNVTDSFEFSFSSHLIKDTGETCLAVDFDIPPHDNYSKGYV